MGNIAYRVGTNITIGFNIDFVGFTLGGKQNATQTDVNTPFASSPAKPTRLNAMLISDNDWGTLNSELYGAYKIDSRISAKVGLGFSFVEYTSETIKQNIGGKNVDGRFRHKSAGLMLGLSYNLKNN
jgi:long-subunit fatty acid transport protein